MSKPTYFLFVLPAVFLLLVSGCRRSTEFGCQAAAPVTVEVNCDTSAEALAAVRDDAVQLAYRMRNLDDGISAGGATLLPDSEIVESSRILNAVRAAIPLIKCADLSPLLDIHPKARYSPFDIYVYVDTTFAWVDAWRNGDIVTGNSQVDSLLLGFPMSVVSFEENSLGSVAHLQCSLPFESSILAYQLDQVPGVTSAFPDGLVGEVDQVEHYPTDDYQLVRLIRGYGDCPSGCINHDTWTFLVYDDFKVVYEGFQQD